jgi:hypothetical protein
MRSRILNAIALIVAFASIATYSACRPVTPLPTPQPPPSDRPTFHFDLATIPDASCVITIEGFPLGPQVVPNGYVYVTYQVPYGSDGKPFLRGVIQFNCDGFVPMQWTDQSWADLQRNNDQGGNNFYTLTPLKPPRIHVPSKDELMKAQYTFQGLRANCPQYDPRPIPIFDPMLDVVDDACFEEILRAHRDAGDQVVGVAISHQYDEPGVIPILRAGRDWTGDLPGLHAFLDRIIDHGFYVQLHLAMDGHSVRGPDGRYTWNDAVGHTYGCEWGNEFFPKLADALEDIHGYIRFLPGYDGTFYGCETATGDVIEMPKFARQFKARWSDGVLGIEFNTGHIPFGEGGDDFLPNGRMWLFDMVFAEFDSDLNQDSAWQIIGRLQHRFGDYKRPPEQPAGDDDGPGKPPAYLIRWPGVLVCFEWDTYFDVRFFTTPAQVNVKRNKLRAMGCPYVG